MASAHAHDVSVPLGRTNSLISTILDTVIAKSFEWLTGLLLLLDVGAVTAGVIWRYFLHDPLQWTEEVACLLLIWITFTGGTVAMQRHSHMSVNILVNKFSARWQAFTKGLILTAQFVFCAFLAYQGYLLCVVRLTELSPLLQVSMMWFMIPVPVWAVEAVIPPRFLVTPMSSDVTPVTWAISPPPTTM
jgi:TRAP-type C4-dicarboxylate transport system permease small subunit